MTALTPDLGATPSSSRRLLRSALCLALCAGSGTALADAVAIVGGVPQVQDFDTLAASGSGTTLPLGWYFAESGNNANTGYVADNGAINSGDTYSYGSTGSGERALGGLQSGNLIPVFGAKLRNDTGAQLGALLVTYTGEQWRLGALGRVDRLDFQYSLDASSLTTGTWTDLDALDFVAPTTTGTAGALDGNAAANRVAISAEISGLAIAADGVLWVRWTDFNPQGSDDGLAIDDISFALPGDNPPAVVSTTPTEGATGVAVSATISLNFSEPVAVDGGGVALACGATPQPLTISGSGSSRTLTPDAALPFGAACTLTVLAAAVTDLDGDLDPMDGDFTLTFNTIADDPPTLQSSIPADGAPDFPANQDLAVTFSEPVSVGASWFSIACSVSGTRQVADTVVSGGPSSWTIDPNADFIAGESCTLQLAAAQILDLDGMQDALSGPDSVAFTVGQPIVNVPPQVLSTVPMDGDDDFPPAADLGVVFSEPVTLQAGAFTLACAQSGTVALTFPSSGTTVAIDTGTALVAGEACTFSIVAEHVRDLEDAPLPDNVVVLFNVRASGAGNYYDQVNTSSPGQLRCTLHQTIRGHTEYPYGWTQLEIADEDPLDDSRILDIYRNCSYAKGSTGDRVGGSGSGATCGSATGVKFNREHVWPRSLGFYTNNNTTRAAHNDLHMLHLSDEAFNAHRGNMPYDYCPQSIGCLEDRTIAYAGQGGGDGSYPGLSNWYSPPPIGGKDGSYEVWSELRGNMARAIFYMAIRYEGGDNLPDLELTNDRNLIVPTADTAQKAWMGILSTLLEWHAQDPVDDRELDRNEVVFQFQGNRNPFVDRPEWATLDLFRSTTPEVCEPLTGDPLIFANGFEP